MSQSRKDEDELPSLPEDITKRELPKHLAHESMGILSRVSHYWHSLFTHDDPWKINLESQLGERRDVLAKFEKLKSEKKISFQYRLMSVNYYRLKKVAEKDVRVKYLLEDENLQFVALASCTDDSSLLPWIPRELQFCYHVFCTCAKTTVVDEIYLNTLSGDTGYLLLRLSVVSRNLFMFRQLTTLNTDIRLLSLAAKNGHEEMLDAILAVTPTLSVTSEILNDIAESGNKELFHKKLKANPSLTLNKDTVDAAARSGNEKWFVEVSAMVPTFVPDTSTLDAAIESKNLPLVLSLMGRGIKPTRQQLNLAASTGNIEIVRELLKVVVPNNDTLEAAARAGSREIGFELLQLKDEHGNPFLLLDDYIFQAAVNSGNRELVHELIQSTDVYITKTTLIHAIASGNIKLIIDLLTQARMARLNELPIFYDGDVYHQYNPGDEYLMDQCIYFLAMADARDLLSTNDVQEAKTNLRMAYYCSSIQFFKDMETILSDKNTEKELRAFLIELIQKQLKRPDLPLGEIEMLNEMLTKFSLAAELALKVEHK